MQFLLLNLSVCEKFFSINVLHHSYLNYALKTINLIAYFCHNFNIYFFHSKVFSSDDFNEAPKLDEINLNLVITENE